MTVYAMLILAIVCFKVDLIFLGWLNVCLFGMAFMAALIDS